MLAAVSEQLENSRPDRSEHYAAAVYGSIVAAALIEAFRAEHVKAEQIALAVLTTMTVFWLAHVWSGIVGDRIQHGPQLQVVRLVRIGRAEWPLVQASFFPVVVLALGWAGVFSDATASRLALGVCILQLFAYGMIVGRLAYHRWPQAIVAGLLNAALGLVLIELEVLVLHH
jgi:hypothetical protein